MTRQRFLQYSHIRIGYFFYQNNISRTEFFNKIRDEERNLSLRINFDNVLIQHKLKGTKSLMESEACGVEIMYIALRDKIENAQRTKILSDHILNRKTKREAKKK